MITIRAAVASRGDYKLGARARRSTVGFNTNFASDKQAAHGGVEVGLFELVICCVMFFCEFGRGVVGGRQLIADVTSFACIRASSFRKTSSAFCSAASLSRVDMPVRAGTGRADSAGRSSRRSGRTGSS